MIKRMTCTKCPRGCQLLVDIDNDRVVGVTGNACQKGDEYARQEVEHPMRLLTSVIKTSGLEMKMAPVRTNDLIPKEMLMKVMALIKEARISAPMSTGEVVIRDVLGSHVDVIVTRSVS